MNEFALPIFASVYTVDVDHGSMINENEAARGEIGLLLCLTSPHATTPPTLFLLSLFYHRITNLHPLKRKRLHVSMTEMHQIEHFLAS